MRVYDEVVTRFGTASAPGLQEQVAVALMNKGITLGQLERSDEAVRVYDEVVTRFGAASAPGLQEQVAKALVNKGYRLGQLERSDEEMRVYDEVVTRFGAASAPGLQEPVAAAMNGIGFELLRRAKKTWLMGNEVQARAILLQAQDQIASADKRQPKHPHILGNLAYLAFLLNNLVRSRELLVQAITIGGEEMRQVELNDAEFCKLPQDEEFQVLVRSIEVVAYS
jgi:hypothetical protein